MASQWNTTVSVLPPFYDPRLSEEQKAGLPGTEILTSYVIRLITNIYRRIFSKRPPVATNALQRYQGLVVRYGPRVQLDALDHIPEELQGDPFLSSVVCPITHAPIRDPVADPTVQEERPVLYERAALLEWVSGHRTSPWTRQPIFSEQVVSTPPHILKLLIDYRLCLYQANLRLAVLKSQIRSKGGNE